MKEDGSVDLNNVSGNINYYFDDSLPLNGPTNKKYGMFIQRQKGRLRSQIWYDWGSEKTEVYSRYYWNNSGTWTTSPWQRLDNFGCNTAADLATLLGALGKCKEIGNVDANTLTDTQLYQISYSSTSTITNKPSSVSQPSILVCIAANNYIIQIWFESTGNCFSRYAQGSGSSWGKWFKFTTTELQ